MKKAEVKKEFERSFPLTLESGDKAAIREHWNNTVDLFQKEGHITLKQAETWVNPFLSKKDR